jgi:hypothetical protein
MSLDRRKDERRATDRRRTDRRHGTSLPVSPLEPPTREDIDQLRSQLEYELRMVRETIEYLSRHGSRVGEADLDAFLESYMLHVTFLLDFFFPTVHGSSRGPCAHEYAPDWADREKISELLARARSKADSLLGGMSFFRIELPTRKEMAAVSAELETLRSRFELLLNVESQAPEEDR